MSKESSNEQFIKSLEWWTNVANNTGSITIGKDDILQLNNFIDDRRAEIERLKYQVNRLKKYDEERDIDLHSRLIATSRAEAVKEFVEKFLAKVRKYHYKLCDYHNSKDYGMFTIGIEQATNEVKEEMGLKGV